MGEAIKAVEKGFAEYSLGRVEMPPRLVLSPVNGWMGIMPAYMRDEHILATKIVTVFPENARFTIPCIIGVLIYTDPSNGLPLAVMDATHLTALRTGAASGVATKYLAAEEVETLTIIGCGAQAETQLEAITAVRNIKKINVFDINSQLSEKFAKDMNAKLGLNICSVANTEKAVEDAGILVTVTTSETPVVRGIWLKEGCHINAIGAHTPNTREFDDDAIKKCKIIVDSKISTLKETGDLVIPLKNGIISESSIVAELGEIILGKKKGRTSSNEITIFKSVGLAVQDATVAKIIYEKAKKLGIGKEIELLS